MKKFSKIGKRVLAFFLVALMNINTYAAIGGNDGSAFVTKSEFDALVNTFNEQMDNYEASLNTKIDGAIANYLASLSNQRHLEIVTGIDLETKGGAKKLRYIKKDAKHLNMDQTPRGNDTIFTSAVGTYRKLAAYEQDTYDTLVYTSTSNVGSDNNLLALVDDENVLSVFKTNAKIDITRNIVFYSTTDANNGLNWTTVKSVYSLPTALYSNSSVYSSSMSATGRAFRRTSGSSAPDSIHTRQAASYVYAENDCDATTGNTTNYNKIDTFMRMYYTADNHNQAITNVKRSTIVNFSGTDVVNFVEHWAQGSNYKLKTSNKEWASTSIMANGYTAATNYTNTVRLRYASGPGAYNSIWPTLTTQGMGVKFNTTDTDVTGVYYNEIYDNWGKKISHGGGFPLYYLKDDDEGTVTIPITLSTQATVCLTETQNTTYPTAGSANIIPLKYRPVGGSWVDVGQNPVLLGASDFEFMFTLKKDQIAYLTAKWETADANLLITQSGKAYMDVED